MYVAGPTYSNEYIPYILAVPNMDVDLLLLVDYSTVQLYDVRACTRSYSCTRTLSSRRVVQLYACATAVATRTTGTPSASSVLQSLYSDFPD